MYLKIGRSVFPLKVKQFLLVSRTDCNIRLVFKETTLKSQREQRVLGITYDSKLTFQVPCDALRQDSSRETGFTQEDLMAAGPQWARAPVQSVIEYSCLAWGAWGGKDDFGRLPRAAERLTKPAAPLWCGLSHDPLQSAGAVWCPSSANPQACQHNTDAHNSCAGSVFSSSWTTSTLNSPPTAVHTSLCEVVEQIYGLRFVPGRPQCCGVRGTEIQC